MEGFTLCSHCFGRNRRNRRVRLGKDKECFICRGLFSEIGSLVSETAKKMKGIEWKTFSVSSTIPREVLIREEDVWDHGSLFHALSIKNGLNRVLAAEVSSATGRKPGMPNPDISIVFDFLRKKAMVTPNPLFIFGRYNKFSRDISQSKWYCRKCWGKGCSFCKGTGRMYISVEDILSAVFIPKANAKEASFHAAGREDIDARMLGDGRPFILELMEPKRRRLNLKKIEKEINKDRRVGVNDLMFVRKEDIPIVTNARFDKDYLATLKAGKKMSKKDLKKIKELEGCTIHQRTPTRVAHRRADKVRKRKIKIIRPTIKKGKIHLLLTVEAGTYVKEFAYGDGGRTRPSISSVLGCKVECDKLDVLKVHDHLLRLVLC